MKGLERTRKDSKGLERTEERRQKTDGVTDKPSTREACASKNIKKNLNVNTPKYPVQGVLSQGSSAVNMSQIKKSLNLIPKGGGRSGIIGNFSQIFRIKIVTPPLCVLVFCCHHLILFIQCSAISIGSFSYSCCWCLHLTYIYN